MTVDITEIKPNEITKPKKLAKKALGLLEAGLGGILQETIGSVLGGFLPAQIPSELAKAGEALGLMTLGGAVDNAHVKNILGGAIAGSAKDLAKMIMSRLNVNLSTLKIGGLIGTRDIAKAPTGATILPSAIESDMEEY